MLMDLTDFTRRADQDEYEAERRHYPEKLSRTPADARKLQARRIIEARREAKELGINPIDLYG